MPAERVLLGAALAVAIVLPAISDGQAQEATSAQPTVNSIYVMNFEVVDLNGDKLVDRAEYDQLHESMFQKSDMDRSGGLSMKEIDGVTPVQFKTVDGDRSGAISLDEYMQATLDRLRRRGRKRRRLAHTRRGEDLGRGSRRGIEG